MGADCCWCWPMDLSSLQLPRSAPESMAGGGWFSFLLQKTCVLLAQALGWRSCQIPRAGGVLPGTSARRCRPRAEWEEEVVCGEHPVLPARRGRGGVPPPAPSHAPFHAARPSGGCSQKPSPKRVGSPCFCRSPWRGKSRGGGCWMNHKSGMALGCVCCMPALSSSGC